MLEEAIPVRGARLLETAKAQADRFRREYPEQVAATRRRIGMPPSNP
jgi:hypothetical protein